MVISGSEDGWIHFYDLVDGETVFRAKGHDKIVNSVAHHPSEVMMITSSFDSGEVKVWNGNSS